MADPVRSQATPPPQVNVARWGWYSIAVNVVLGAINLVVALASGSLAVRAEMIHNFVDKKGVIRKLERFSYVRFY